MTNKALNLLTDKKPEFQYIINDYK